MLPRRIPFVRLQRRFLNLQEYQSKQLMTQFGLNTQKFKIVEEASQAEQAAADLKAAEIVIKAQILAGGRGKGTFSSGLRGGVQLTKNVKEVQNLVSQMIGYKLKTHQTVSEGVLVKRVMLAEAKDLAKETYVAVLLDRTIGSACLVVCEEGGVDIEQVAESNPAAIKKFPIFNGSNCSEICSQAAQFLFPLESEPIQMQAKGQLENLIKLFNSVDATMVEINPFGLTPEGEVLCFDAKLEFDENSAFRQEKIFKMAAVGEEAEAEICSASNSVERIAREHGLNYVKMDGNIGCLVNGAGLAMATMDLISLKGGQPANFLDVGGGATSAQIKTALEILLKDSQVTAILVNIFGGIMRCDIIAAGIIAAANAIDPKLFTSKSLIVRLSGTNSEIGMKMLLASGIEMKVCDDAEEAAIAACSATNGCS